MMLRQSGGEQVENLTSPDEMQAFALRRMFRALPMKCKTERANKRWVTLTSHI